VTLRWGFKTEARQIASEIRVELGLSELDRLDAFALAEHLEIPAVAVTEMGPAAPEAVAYLCDNDVGAFSAAVVFVGSRRVIVYNDAHAPTRVQSDPGSRAGACAAATRTVPGVRRSGLKLWRGRGGRGHMAGWSSSGQRGELCAGLPARDRGQRSGRGVGCLA